MRERGRYGSENCLRCGKPVDREYLNAKVCNACSAAAERRFWETMAKRKQNWGKIKRAVLARDGYQCRHCGRTVRHGDGRRDKAADVLSFDHVVPIARGGEQSVENVVVACLGCNGSKGAKADWSPSKVRA